MNRLVAFLLVAMVSLLTACASPAPRRSAVAPSSLSDADRLTAAALRSWATQRDASQALTLIERAAEMEQDRADIAWLQIRLCMQARGCEPQAIETRLRKIDPDNGIVWLGALSRAQARRDERAGKSILQAMSRAQRFDLYWTDLVWRLTAASTPATPAAPPTSQSAPPSTPLTTTLNDVIGWLSRLATPAFHPVTMACEPQRAQDTAARNACALIAQAMQRSDTTLVEGLGLGIAQRLAAPGSPEATALDQRVATLAYRTQTAGSLVQAQVEREKFSNQVLQLMKQLPREQDVWLAILRWAGRPLSPTTQSR